MSEPKSTPHADEAAAPPQPFSGYDAYDALLRQGVAGVSQTDREGRFVLVNDAYCRLVGRSREELLTLRMADITHPEDLPRNRVLFRDAIERGLPFLIEKRYLRPGGDIVWVQNCVMGVRDETGTVVGLMAVSMDLTERREAEAALRLSEERARLAVEATGIGTWDFDATAGTRRWSPEFLAIVGLPPDTPGDYDRFAALTHPEDRDWVVERYQQAFDPAGGGLYEAEFRIVRADDGAERWVALRGRVLFDEARRHAVRAIGTIIDVTARRQAEEALRARTAELEAVLEAVPAAVWFTRDPSARQIVGNRYAARLFRQPESANLSMSAPDLERPEGLRILRDGHEVSPDHLPMQLAVRGLVVRGDELELRYEDGTSATVLANAIPLRDERQRIVGAVGASLDISERKRAEEHMKLLLAELNHRVKNTLATVQSIAQQTLRGATSPEVFAEAFNGRLLALSKVHDLLTRASWAGASLGDVVRQTLAPHGPAGDARRLEIGGPEVRLGPNAAVTLSMALHELATNAAKYGALSVPGGQVRVAWSVERDGEAPPTLLLDWRETGGPPVTPPRRRGFGSRLIERGLSREMGGSAQLDFQGDGLRCRMRLPISRKITLPQESGR